MNFSTTYHPQIDGQTERVSQVLEDIISMYVMDKLGKCGDYLHLEEFAYNNNFQVSAGMSQFEILYGHKCNTLISWSILVERLMLGPDLLKYMELIMKPIQQNLKASQDLQKIYADLKRTPREF